MKEPHQHLARRRSLFRRFEQHAIAGEQGRDDVIDRNARGQHMGRDDCHDPMRLVAQGRARAECPFELSLAGAFGIGVNGLVDALSDLGDFLPGVPQRTPRLARDQVGEDILRSPHPVGEAAHRLDAIGRWHRSPGRPTPFDEADLRCQVAGRSFPE